MTDREERRKAPQILVADDDRLIRRMASDGLAELGFEVLEASGGAEALDAVARRRPDLVLLDLEMPDPGGLQVCREIRSLPAGRELPVVIMTAREDVETIRRAYETGASEYVVKPVHWLIVGHRIRRMLAAQRVLDELRGSRMRLAEAQRIAGLGNWELGAQWCVFSGSEEFLAIYGFAARDAPVGLKAFLSRVHENDRERLEGRLRESLSRGAELELDHRVVRADGEERFVHLCARPRLDDGEIRLEGIVQDVTERRRAEERVRFLAFHDSLTGLGNRAFFQKRLESALVLAERRRHPLALLFLDLDHFKRINDTFGHSAGDDVLRTVAGRLSDMTRRTDCVARVEADEAGGDGPVARLGGDEFSILLDQVSDAQDATRVCRRIMAALSQPIAIQDQELVVSGSVGVAVYPDDGRDADALIRSADVAMYHAKRAGRGAYQYHSHGMNLGAQRRVEMESRFRKALELGELEIHYQPKVNTRSGLITGFEALTRWTDEKLGPVPPPEFISLAEEMGLIVTLGEAVLRAACARVVSWSDARLGDLQLAVNLSPRQLRDEELPQLVARALQDTGLEPAGLELEITEGALIHNEEKASKILMELKAMGIRISLDDFGTGYSSMSYLKRFPVDCVKIDRSFVEGIGTNRDDAAISATILSMAENLRLWVVAEGVETGAQLAFLREHGCQEVQGFLFSRPLPGEGAAELLRRGGHLPTGEDD